MDILIREARRRLPQAVRQVREDAGPSVQITARDEVVAALRAAPAGPEPGAAAAALLQPARELPKRRGRRAKTSERIKEYLYGRATKPR